MMIVVKSLTSAKFAYNSFGKCGHLLLFRRGQWCVMMLKSEGYRKALIFRGLYISRINGKTRFRESYFRENRMKWYRGGDRWHVTHTYVIKRIDLVQH